MRPCRLALGYPCLETVRERISDARTSHSSRRERASGHNSSAPMPDEPTGVTHAREGLQPPNTASKPHSPHAKPARTSALPRRRTDGASSSQGELRLPDSQRTEGLLPRRGAPVQLCPPHRPS